eukprot:CAMPEP_0174319244 /NCGR_PEP_ID=MMETSP0810-20121108/8735_1 /TAXON_ID=73025 ORGANISM="Eutreptiella gymnastica-like, Strain CCMP1594" /NCGR_SAMPLE_ID=MMETSP0810 /ASSEMBLY_ACC=CAM_ASM_000659 /LENGTH=149 /DNA_ID=CAMNT_0015429721 /DNA_START=743 /DNA_END=1192 /DNA_ORIENTATION=-
MSFVAVAADDTVPFRLRYIPSLPRRRGLCVMPASNLDSNCLLAPSGRCTCPPGMVAVSCRAPLNRVQTGHNAPRGAGLPPSVAWAHHLKAWAHHLKARAHHLKANPVSLIDARPDVMSAGHAHFLCQSSGHAARPSVIHSHRAGHCSIA